MTTPTAEGGKLLELANAIETDDVAGQEDRLYDAWDALADVSSAFRAYAFAHAARFTRLLESGGYLEAAIMLVPEEWFTKLALEDRHSHSWRWTLRGGFGVELSARASTPTLALCAAALRAHAHSHTKGADNA